MDLKTGINEKDLDNQRLGDLFGEALGDLPTAAETGAAWETFARRHHQARRRRLYLPAAGIAAAVALLLAVWQPWQAGNREIEVFAPVDSPRRLTFAESGGTITALTPPATTTAIELADGTRVELCANSKLEYPDTFTGTLREVRLTGKARFDVAPDTARPFVVSTGSYRTRVLGTVFDVDAYVARQPQVTLYEGRVRLSDIDRRHTRDIRPGERATVSAEGDIRLAKTKSTPREGWTQGEFLFDNAELGSVMREIGSWYNTRVVFHTPGLLEERIYFRLSRQAPVDRVLDALNDLGIARFETEGQKIVVSR